MSAVIVGGIILGGVIVLGGLMILAAAWIDEEPDGSDNSESE